MSIQKNASLFKLKRRFTRAGTSPLDEIAYRQGACRIVDAQGNLVFELSDIEVPASWSQLAVDILISKYLRRGGVPGEGHETSVRHVVSRITHTLKKVGLEHGYFDQATGDVFADELAHLLIHQKGAFNSPVWFNLGLSEAYGIKGSGGNYFFDETTGEVVSCPDAYAQPQCSACFIQSVEDELLSIFELLKNEAKLFKYGSGTGTNFSKLRSRHERLSGGGSSSGLMSFLEVLDRGASATKSGGTTRRAAKMVCLDLDHPEIEDFISWKAREEKKAKVLIAAGYSSDFNGEAYHTVAGQNANLSVRVSHAFMDSLKKDEDWFTRARVSGEILSRIPARELWTKLAEASWASADPGLQFDDTVNEWHTCKNSGPIRASNPCSEFMFLDDTACNLASLNLVKFLDADLNFDAESFEHACRLFILAQEILVSHSSYPTAVIAQNSQNFRPLGLGFANLGSFLMIKGLPYDSEEGRQWAALITALMSGSAYQTSAELAAIKGPFAGFSANRESMLEVLSRHRAKLGSFQFPNHLRELASIAHDFWTRALELGQKQGFRNAQVSVIAPTGTIGLLMDCDTTGIEPDFALIKFKKLAGGGHFRMVNASVERALLQLGYSAQETAAISQYLKGSLHFNHPNLEINREFLREKSWSALDIADQEKRLEQAYDLRHAFTKAVMGEDLLVRLGVAKRAFDEANFNYLTWVGLSEKAIEAANLEICGRLTLEGAPYLKPEHLPVFDCANPCGPKGVRFIKPKGHLHMMAAVQPFLSGAISKTINLPNQTTVGEIEEIHAYAYALGLKSVALYRDGCKSSQPLNARPDAVDVQLSVIDPDAPHCDRCDRATIRSGSCYRCLNCGTTIGCS